MAKLAARLGNFVQWFKHPRIGSLAGSRTGPRTPVNAPKHSPVAVAAPVNDGGVMMEDAELDEPLLPAKKAKESPVEKLQRGYEEMISLMGSVRNHMETQAERSERLLTILEGLPDALKSMPEATRNQTRTLEAIQTNLTQQVQHNTKLADALNGLAKSTQHHEHAMSAIGQQLDAGHQRSEQILGSFNTLTGTLGRMTDANEASTGLLRRMAEQESQAAEQVRQLFVRNQKQMTTMSVVSWSLALVALTVAGYVAVSVSKLGGMTGPATPTPTVTSPTPAQIAPATTIPASTNGSDTPAVAPEVNPAVPAVEKPVAEEPATKTGLLDDSAAKPDAVATQVDAGGATEETDDQ